MQEKDFWDWLDLELASIHEKYANCDPPMPLAEQGQKISRYVADGNIAVMLYSSPHRIFLRALTKHTNTFPAVLKPQTRTLPAWQEELSRAVVEMESYTQGDLGASGETSIEDD